jgi:hypothetical protein
MLDPATPLVEKSPGTVADRGCVDPDEGTIVLWHRPISGRLATAFGCDHIADIGQHLASLLLPYLLAVLRCHSHPLVFAGCTVVQSNSSV